MHVISELKSITITKVVKELADKSAEIITGDSTSYPDFKKHVQSHEASVIDPDMILKLMP